MILVRAYYGGRPYFFLLAGGNWNNGLNAGPSYRNTNNDSSNSNRNIGTHLELRSPLGGPEQRTDPSLISETKFTTSPKRGISTKIESSSLSAGLSGAT